jgi:hypothetical protein
MKRYASGTLKVLGIGYMAFPASYLLCTAILFQMPLSQVGRLLLSPWYYVFSLLGIITGFGLWGLHRWAWYLLLALHFLALYSNAILLAEFSKSQDKLAAYSAATLMIALLTFRIDREIRVPYLLPRIRWWESDPRHRLSLSASVQGLQGTGALPAECLDLAWAGCFLKTRHDFKADETVLVTIQAYGLKLQCAGAVVWRTQSGVTVPRGIGVKFVPIPKEQKRVFRAVLTQIRRINRHYRSSRYLLSQEEYFKRLHELQTANLSAPALQG